VKHVFEWGIAADAGGRPAPSPVGISDDEPRARSRMLEALGGLPAGVAATGWVTILGLAPSQITYIRLDTPVLVVRDGSGALQWLAGNDDKPASPSGLGSIADGCTDEG
jgi:hypothetical protein